jgi:hypothetical protein
VNFCGLQRFRRKTALLGPKISLTDLQSPRKNGTNAETYGEPQTPVNRFTVALPSELPEFSTAANSAKRVMLQFKATSSNSIDFRLPMCGALWRQREVFRLSCGGNSSQVDLGPECRDGLGFLEGSRHGEALFSRFGG